VPRSPWHGGPRPRPNGDDRSSSGTSLCRLVATPSIRDRAAPDYEVAVPRKHSNPMLAGTLKEKAPTSFAGASPLIQPSPTARPATAIASRCIPRRTGFGRLPRNNQPTNSERPGGGGHVGSAPRDCTDTISVHCQIVKCSGRHQCTYTLGAQTRPSKGHSSSRSRQHALGAPAVTRFQCLDPMVA
jgi:hypothetical protein